MTKQELEQAIKNRESMWYVLDNGAGIIEAHWGIREFDMFDENYVIYYDQYCYRVKAKIQNFYKTKAEAEHYLHHANITRTEQLPFLTWEEFLDEKELFFTNTSGYPMCLQIIDTKLGKKIGLGSSNGYFDLDKTWDLTEENFYKAYDECITLFKG